MRPCRGQAGSDRVVTALNHKKKAPLREADPQGRWVAREGPREVSVFVLELLLLCLPERSLEGIHVKFHVAFRLFEIVDTEADAHIRTNRVALEVRKGAISSRKSHVVL